MHIALVNNQSQLGGAETVLSQLRTGLIKHGHNVTVHTADAKTCPTDVQPLYPRWLNRLNHSRLHAPIEFLFPKDVWTDRQFRKLAEHPCDLVHIHNFHGRYASIESLAYLAKRKPTVWTFHALWGVTGGCDHPGDCRRYQQQCGSCPQVGRWPVGEFDNTADQLKRKMALLAPLPLHVVSPSLHVAEVIQESRVGRKWTVHHIPNGVDLLRFDPSQKQDPELRRSLGLDPDRPVLLVVNRNFQDYQKGYQWVEEALRQLPADSVQLVLIGNDSEWALKRLAHRGQALGYVKCPDLIARFYNAADYFVFASPAETFPCVILEAMAAGCCVVSTPTNGVLEQVEDQDNGWLASNISGPALSNTLQRALAERARSRSFGLKARATVKEKFSEDQMIRRYLELYRELTEPRSWNSAPTSPLTTAAAP